MFNRSLRPARHTARAGFTLVEMLAVIMVISILVALLVPAVMRGFVTVRNGSVSTEISQLEAAIGKFRATYGMDPPSSIVLYEAGGGAQSVNGAWDATNMAIIRQLWPSFDFVTAIDINGNGTKTDVIPLAGPECLVFFLGGINGNSNAPGTNTTLMGACIGFSKNPAYPFVAPNGATSALYSANRDKSGYDFLPARFVDLNQNGFPEYVDPLPSQTSPYLYYSSYDGQGYDTSTALLNSSVSSSLVSNDEFNYIASVFSGLSGYVYQQSATTFWKPNSFQIISPGYDHKYGYGGIYLSTGSDHLPATAVTGPLRAYERDNISNFSIGVMQQ